MGFGFDGLGMIVRGGRCAGVGDRPGVFMFMFMGERTFDGLRYVIRDTCVRCAWSSWLA